MNVKLLTILLTACICVVTGKRLRWAANTDLDNPDNFDPKGPPCRNDHLTFPARSPSVYFQRNQTLMEIVLPNDGEIVLGEGSVLTFPERDDNSCAGRNIRFVGAVAKSWFDPGNWCVTDSSGDNCLSSQPDLLDTDRIPCDSDDVVFPSGSGFYVDLDTGIAIQMGSLKIAGQTMTTDSFRSYLNSDEGKLQFTSVNGTISSVRVTIGGTQTCSEDSSDCLCRNATETFQGRVCDLESPRCQHGTCAKPFQPVGRCCHVCGALLVLSFRPGFRIRDLQSLIARTFRYQNVDQRNVTTIVSKINEGVIQVVLESTNNEADAWSVGRKVKEELDRDPSYGAFEIHLLLSELDQPAHHTGDEPSSKAGLIVGLIVALIIIVVVIILVAIYCYRNRDRLPSRPRLPSVTLPSPPDFRSIFRSDSRSRDKEDYEMRRQVAVFDNSRAFDVSLGFENPSYGDLYANMGIDDPDLQKGEFSNPMYGSSQHVGEKQPIPDDYVAYNPPPSKSSESVPSTTPAEPRVKMVEDDQDAGGRRAARETSDGKRVEALGKRLQSPFRLVASKLKGPKLEEEEADPEEEGPGKEGSETRMKASGGGNRKGQKGSMFVRPREHERLAEMEGDDVERKTRRVAEGKGKEGFGNPLYAMEESGVYDADLGEPGSTSTGYETGPRGGRRPGTGKGDMAGFENPLFDDSKKPELEPGVASQKIIGAVEKDDESTA